MPAWTPRAREPSPRLRARLRCPRNLPDYLPGLRARALGEVVSPRDEPAAGNLHGGVCEGGVPRCRHGGPKRARSRKRWIGPRNTYSIPRSPLLGNIDPIILKNKIEELPAVGACVTFPERRGLWKSEQKCQPLNVQESEPSRTSPSVLCVVGVPSRRSVQLAQRTRLAEPPED